MPVQPRDGLGRIAGACGMELVDYGCRSELRVNWRRAPRVACPVHDFRRGTCGTDGGWREWSWRVVSRPAAAWSRRHGHGSLQSLRHGYGSPVIGTAAYGCADIGATADGRALGRQRGLRRAGCFRPPAPAFGLSRPTQPIVGWFKERSDGTGERPRPAVGPRGETLPPMSHRSLIPVLKNRRLRPVVRLARKLRARAGNLCHWQFWRRTTNTAGSARR
jgi:hypothetical protein